QAIIDRNDESFAPKLRAIIGDKAKPAAQRIAALWANNGLPGADPLIKALLADDNRNIRREAARLTGIDARAALHIRPNANDQFSALRALAKDPDPQVRAEAIRALGLVLATWNSDKLPTLVPSTQSMLSVLCEFAQAPLAEPMAPATRNGKPI